MQNRFAPHSVITDADILSLRPAARPFKLSIGQGAYIKVMPNGAKYWRLKFFIDGREDSYSLGVFPKVSLDAARAARDEAKALIRRGINPSVAKREAKIKAVAAQTITQAVFRLGLSKGGALTIETEMNSLTLTCAQTQALAAFLTVKEGNGKEAQECR